MRCDSRTTMAPPAATKPRDTSLLEDRRTVRVPCTAPGRGATAALEVGAGTGQDSLFFKQNGLEVTATDLSPQMVEPCRAKRLPAHVMDFLHLDFAPASFDAVYALNCLLHVPNGDLPAVLEAIDRLMCAKGLLYVGLYGGDQQEGQAEHDDPAPPRVFSLPSDDQIPKPVQTLFGT